MSTRNTGKQNTIATDTAFAAAMELYAHAERREAELNKHIGAEVNELLEKYTGELEVLAQNKKMAFEAARTYCTGHKQELFAQRRSVGTLHGIAGFRLGHPQLKTLQGNSWGQVLAAIKEKLPAYVRTTEEPAKDMLLADRHKEHVAPLLMQIGVQVVQEELFYIEPKKAA